jgi:catechol-2,3-dioxygenase
MTSLRVLLISLALTISAFPLTAVRAATTGWSTEGGFVAVRAKDVTALAKWYERALGFEILSLRPGGSTLLQRGSAVIELVQRDDRKGSRANAADDLGTPGIYKFGFVVDDLDALTDHLKKRLVPVQGRVIVSDVGGLRTLAVTDPDGNLIQFFGR